VDLNPIIFGGPVTEQSLTLHGRPPAKARARFSWALFDWANQPFFTLITTFIFFPYFASDFIGDAVRGQSILGLVLGIAGGLIAVISPILGAIADTSGPRKPWLFVLSVVYVLGCFALWWAEPGAPQRVIPMAMAIILSTVAIEAAIVFNNAMLPSLVARGAIGRLSGYAWGLGYLGGLVALFIVLFGFALPGTVDWPFLPEEPLLGLDRAAFEPERITGPLAAIWYMIFVLPLFLFVPDQPKQGKTLSQSAVQGLATLWQTVKGLKHYKNIAVYLFARMIYNDGIAAIFAFGGVYARGMFGWDLISLGIFGIVLAFFAAIGAALGGVLDDKLGSKRTILLAVGGLVLATWGAANITADSVLGIPVSAPTNTGGLFASTPEQAYLAFSILIGLCAGPSQAASRTFMARLAPPDLTTEFFGLYALSGKATAFLAPLAVGAATATFASQRAGLFAIVIFLLAGMVALLFVRSPRPSGT